MVQEGQLGCNRLAFPICGMRGAFRSDGIRLIGVGQSMIKNISVLKTDAGRRLKQRVSVRKNRVTLVLPRPA
jgi:hypothetical protein